MNTCLGENVKISLPAASKEKMKEKNKTLVIKGVPTEFADDRFKEILDSNKIQYAKAESMKTGEIAGRSKCFN